MRQNRQFLFHGFISRARIYTRLLHHEKCRHIALNLLHQLAHANASIIHEMGREYNSLMRIDFHTDSLRRACITYSSGTIYFRPHILFCLKRAEMRRICTRPSSLLAFLISIARLPEKPSRRHLDKQRSHMMRILISHRQYFSRYTP